MFFGDDGQMGPRGAGTIRRWESRVSGVEAPGIGLTTGDSACFMPTLGLSGDSRTTIHKEHTDVC